MYFYTRNWMSYKRKTNLILIIKLDFLYKNRCLVSRYLIFWYLNLSRFLREKGRDLTQSYDKSPFTNRNVKMSKWQHKQRHKKFDYTAVVDRLRSNIKNYFIIKNTIILYKTYLISGNYFFNTSKNTKTVHHNFIHLLISENEFW